MTNFDPNSSKDRSGRSQAEKKQASLLSDLAKSLDLQHHNTSLLHQFGGAFEAPTTVSGGPNGSVGIAESPARSDHVHGGQNAVGTIRMTINGNVEPGWITFNGATIIGGSTLYPELWKILPASMKSGADIITPDWTNRFPISHDSARTVGQTFGSHQTTISAANLPPHAHGVNINSGFVSADHAHGGGNFGVLVGMAGTGSYQVGAGGNVAMGNTGGANANHYHNVSGSSDNGPGSGVAMNTFPAAFDIYMKVLAY